MDERSVNLSPTTNLQHGMMDGGLDLIEKAEADTVLVYTWCY